MGAFAVRHLPQSGMCLDRDQSECQWVRGQGFAPVQGLRAWLALRSQRGQPAGAVQVAVHLTWLDGCAWPSAPAGSCAHERV